MLDSPQALVRCVWLSGRNAVPAVAAAISPCQAPQLCEAACRQPAAPACPGGLAAPARCRRLYAPVASLPCSPQSPLVQPSAVAYETGMPLGSYPVEGMLASWSGMSELGAPLMPEAPCLIDAHTLVVSSLCE